VNLVVVLSVFGIVFIGELPDKTAVASLVLGARYSALPVLAGVWAAFAVHVIVACIAGGFVAALPRRPVEFVTAALFLLGAVLLLRSDPEAAAVEGEHEVESISGERKGFAVAGASFMVVLVAEFGDLTQILTATLAARYHQPFSVGIGAVLALWAVAAIAVIFGQTLLKLIPLRRVQQVAAVVLVVMSILALVSALSGDASGVGLP
jgi:putative Ca2+/H+ antiporter (TMEM165/GDT1 family)